MCKLLSSFAWSFGQGVRYRSEVVKNFDIWLNRVSRFREAVEARRKKRDLIIVGQIAETVKVPVETIEKNGPRAATTQLVRPRIPLLWSRQEFDRWRIETEKWLAEQMRVKDIIEYVNRTPKVGDTLNKGERVDKDEGFRELCESV